MNRISLLSLFLVNTGGGGLDATAAMREAEDKSVMEDIQAAEEDYDSPEEVRVLPRRGCPG